MPHTRESDERLLREFAKTRGEAPFRELVERHSPFVHSIAHRETGDADLSKDVTQQVFILLARNAERLATSRDLLPWLHRVTCNRARDSNRSELRRRKRETVAMELRSQEPDAGQWEKLAPEVDALVDRLPTADRHALLLRFYMGHSYEEVARNLRSTPEAARKRCERSLEKLRALLARKGITTSRSSLAGLLSIQGPSTGPSGLPAQIAAGVEAATLPASMFSGFLLMTTTLKLSLAATTAAIAVLGVAVMNREEGTDATSREQAPPKNISSVATRTADTRNPLPRPPGRTRGESSPTSTLRADLKSILLMEGPERHAALADYLSGLSPSELKEAYAYAITLNSSVAREDDRDSILTAWLGKDADDAMKWAANNEPGILNKMAGMWSALDQDAAIAWARDAGEGHAGGNPYFASIIRGLPMGPDGFEAANELVLSMPEGKERFRAMGEAASKAEAMGPEYTRNWIANLPEDLQNEGFSRSVLSLTAKDPVNTIDWMRSTRFGQDESGLTSEHAISQVLNEVSKGDLDAVTKYIESLPGDERERWDRQLRELGQR